MGEWSPAPTAPLPHVLVVAFPAQGHVNPQLRLAKLVASKGVLVTFSSTAAVGKMITSSTGAVPGGEGVPVGRGRLRFEFLDDGGVHGDIFVLMPHLEAAGPPALAELVQRQATAGRPVTSLLTNPFMPWSLDFAVDAGIPAALLWVQSAAVFSIYYHYEHALAEFPSTADSDLVVSLPGLPPLASGAIPTFLLSTNPFKQLTEAILAQFKNVEKATWVFANTFAELEPEPLAALSKLGQPLIPVGPLVDSVSGAGDDTPKADLMKAAAAQEWLDAQPARSVVYVSLGSVVTLTKEEMAEMAHGLQSTGRPFLWVVRPDSEYLLPDGFLHSGKVAGDSASPAKWMIVGWSQQERVLSHPAVACFITHCGWNSTLEALAAGVPVVGFPQWGDQVTDAMFAADVYGTGVVLPSPVERAVLKDTVAAATEGPRAEQIRAKTEEWKAKARKAIKQGGSSDKNIQAFVDKLWDIADPVTVAVAGAGADLRKEEIKA